MFGNSFQKFGTGVKNVIGGMVLGLFLLPLGIYMQYCSANQMPYHKEFKKAVEVKSPADISKDSALIKTEGNYSLSAGPYKGIKTPEGDVFSGTFISYEVNKYIVKQEKVDKKDDKGNVIGTDYKYSWVKDQALGSSDSGLTVTVNSFTVKFGDFSQNYIAGETKYFKYINSRQIFGSKENISGEQNGYPKDAVESDYINRSYAVVISGKIFDPNDKDMSITGIAAKGSKTLTPKIKKVPLSFPQSFMAITYGNFTQLYESLENQTKMEGIGKFIIGSIFFLLGFCGLFGPILKLLDFIPFFGNMALGLIYFILAVVSLILSFLFYVFFQFFWILVALAVIIPIVLIVMNTMKKKAV